MICTVAIELFEQIGKFSYRVSRNFTSGADQRRGQQPGTHQIGEYGIINCLAPPGSGRYKLRDHAIPIGDQYRLATRPPGERIRQAYFLGV
jgi:hypothetical protein